MNWSCEQIEARLSEYLDGALAAGEKAGFPLMWQAARGVRRWWRAWAAC